MEARRQQLVQRPCGRRQHDILEELKEGLCDWSAGSKGRRGPGCYWVGRMHSCSLLSTMGFNLRALGSH